MPVTDITKDTDNHALVITAEYPVSVERLWQVWADPRQLERWWGPETHPATVTEHDLTPGGVVRYHMTGPDGQLYPGGWEITSVDEPRGFTARDFFADADGNKVEDAPVSTMTVELSETPEGARMVTTSAYATAEELQTVLDMGMEEGSRSAAGQIDALLAA
ncbi:MULTISPECIES: SRPBCC domain-containing protein [Janibacter]|uniref:SRPBCC family protein n=1 Tax=Janibacter TaxID=53457 RepID=UPI00082DA73A|nr:SRPBCC domain-containing protein [Janibacter terrae]MBA4084467.1 SRPBCC domain-containing protein [Kytococcus sp.]HCE60678.1 SRPBCC domain-containing protein [Janibacter terrae]